MFYVLRFKIIMKKQKTFVYSVANQKGGVGKTTTTVNLAALIASKNQRVLIIDADPQANATSSLGIKLPKNGYSLYDVLVNEIPLAKATLPTSRQSLFIVPAVPDLAAAEIEMIQFLAREMTLKKAMSPILEQYDFIFIDTPPSLGLLTINALTASDDGIIIPVQCEYLPLEGLSRLKNTVTLIQKNLNPTLQIAGVVLTMFDGRTNLANEVVNEVRQHFPQETFQTVIPRNVRLSEAPSFGQDILGYAPNSAGCLAYQALAEELLKRVNHL